MYALYCVRQPTVNARGRANACVFSRTDGHLPVDGATPSTTTGMNSLATNQIEIGATSVRVSDDALVVDLSDGANGAGAARLVSAIVAWHGHRKK